MRHWVVEAKVAVTRVSGYTGALTFLLVLALWFDRAYGRWGWQAGIPYAAFMGVAFLAAVTAGTALAWWDRRVVWPSEGGVNARVVPMARSEAMRSAWFMVAHGDAAGVERARKWFQHAGLGDEYDHWVRYWRERLAK